MTPRPETTRRLVVLLVVGGCIATAAVLGLGGGGTSPAGSTGSGVPAAIPTVAEPDAVSTSWYCATGTSAPGGRTDETVLVANQGRDDARAVVSVMPGGPADPVSRRVTVPRGAQVRVPVLSVVQAAEQPGESGMTVGPGVVVEVFGGRSVVEHEIDGEGDTAVGPCARQPGPDWYFAAGTTERGAEQNAALFNPFPDDAIVDITFATDAGFIAPADLQAVVVPRRTRVTVPIADFIRRQAQVGVHVHARTGRVVAEQSLVFTAENEMRRGLTLSLGAPGPEPSWTLPGVNPDDEASHAVLVANFGTSASEVEITPRFEERSAAKPQPVPVGGRSVAIVDLAAIAGSRTPFGVVVRTTRPSSVVVEELAWWSPPAPVTGSATVLASPVEAPAWTFAVGRPTPEAAGEISVVNPGRTDATVTLGAYAPGGGDAPRNVAQRTVPAGEQARFDLGDAGVAPDQVVVVRASTPVVAVRRILGPSGASLALGVATP